MDLQNFYNKSGLSEDEQDMIVRVLREDLSTSMAEMSNKTGIKYSRVRSSYKYLGISSKDTAEAKALKQQTVLMLKIKPLYARGYSRREISEAIGVSAPTVTNICKKFNLKKGRTPRHGTAVEYDHHGCRCETCITANRERCYAVKANMKARESDIPHGTMTGYWNWACRCAACKKVGSDINKQRVATPPETQWNKGERWVGAEESAIESYDMTARELAMSLGRTTGGVNTRRSTTGIRNREVEILSR